ncbi:uncharacterized, partial [Tachysurus ichikawai]
SEKDDASSENLVLWYCFVIIDLGGQDRPCLSRLSPETNQPFVQHQRRYKMEQHRAGFTVQG